MRREPLNLDTAPDVESRQVERWRVMTPGEKLALAVAMSDAVRRLAWAGVQHRHPHASAREQFLRLAIVILGTELARRAYPEIETLASGE